MWGCVDRAVCLQTQLGACKVHPGSLALRDRWCIDTDDIIVETQEKLKRGDMYLKAKVRRSP